MMANPTEAELFNALNRRGKATKEMRAARMTTIACPCNCGIIVRETGHKTHLVRIAPGSATLICDCTLAKFNKVCSHVIAIQGQMGEAVIEKLETSIPLRPLIPTNSANSAALRGR